MRLSLSSGEYEPISNEMFRFLAVSNENCLTTSIVFPQEFCPVIHIRIYAYFHRHTISKSLFQFLRTRQNVDKTFNMWHQIYSSICGVGAASVWTIFHWKKNWSKWNSTYINICEDKLDGQQTTMIHNVSYELSLRCCFLVPPISTIWPEPNCLWRNSVPVVSCYIFRLCVQCARK